MTYKFQVLIAFFVSFLFTNTFAQPKKDNLTISHLTGDFYIFTTYKSFNGNYFPANGMYLVTDRGVVMIDTPWDTTQFQPLLDSIIIKHNKTVLMCIATHSHEDRTGGLEFLRQKGVKTYTTIQTDIISKERGEKRAEFLISKDTIFKMGKYSFQTKYPGQGHTPDNIVVWFGKAKILYGGCLIKSTEASNLGNLADANVKDWPGTIKNIQKSFPEPNFIVPGHQDWTSKKSLEHTLELLRQNE